MCSAVMEQRDDTLGPVVAMSWRREIEARGSGGVTAMADRLGDRRWRRAQVATTGLGMMMDAGNEAKGDRDGRGRSEAGSRPTVRGFTVEDLRRELGCGVHLKLEVRCEDGSDRGRRDSSQPFKASDAQSSVSVVEGEEETVSLQETQAASSTSQPIHHRANRDEDFDLDLEDIMVMEAI